MTDIETETNSETVNELERLMMQHSPSFTSAVRFQPWIGQDYGWNSTWRIPVLVLADSHYDCGEELTLDFTTKVTRRHSRTYRFWKSITQAFLGKEDITDAESDAFWNSVAFYNFVQESAGRNGSSTPTKEMYQRAVPAFREVLQVLKPRCIIVVCVRTWNNLPEGTELERQGQDLTIGNAKKSSWLYSIGNGEFAHASRIPHPSMRRRWNYGDWHQWIRLALDVSISNLDLSKSGGE